MPSCSSSSAALLDLDAPVTKYLPDFKPDNPFDKADHAAADDVPPLRPGRASRRSATTSIRRSVAGQTVESLNQTELVYEPETKTKYSNAAIAAVGFVLEETQKQPFARYLRRTLLDPLGMKRSSFEPDPA